MSTNDKGRPRVEGGPEDEQPGGRDVAASVRHPYIVAAEMLAESPERERSIADAMWTAGFGVGFVAGEDVGYGRAHAEMDRAWADLAAKVRGLASSPKHDELERRRWDGRRENFGRPRPGDYLGGPVEWETGRPVRGRGTAA
ncbi:hypothetical protein [Actinomadura xylanilytica]|uniref:hypothetical protein n=1 Tax=Actinomadura xylanilytica TaxID=887459 RepID=UPI00255B294F|nr:hypothetical protein [Actinomadura xylanilytica]MDL4772916.1 hypothetical protein [Actinomadura xylanilytica]